MQKGEFDLSSWRAITDRMDVLLTKVVESVMKNAGTVTSHRTIALFQKLIVNKMTERKNMFSQLQKTLIVSLY
jgi:hypothetical protein